MEVYDELEEALKEIERLKEELKYTIPTVEHNKTIQSNINSYNKLVKYSDELEDRINKAIEYIKENCILSDCWEDLDFCNFVPIGKIKYKPLSSKKVKVLLDILKGDDKE